MPKIQIIRSAIESVETKSGIGYYADYIESQLKESNQSVDVVTLDIDSKYGFRNISNLFKSVLQIIKGRGEYDVIHASAEHCSILLPFSKSKRIVTFHHVMKKGEADTESWYLFWKISVFISKFFTDEYIAVSPQTKDEMITELGIHAEKITVAMHPPKSNMYVENEQKENMVLFVGMFMERKNPKGSVLVFKEMLNMPEFQGYKFIMCGEGPQKKDIEKMIYDMDLEDNVDIVSNIPVDDLRGLYNRSRFLLNTSNFEGLGITTLEAQLCGTPVLYFKDANLPPEVMVAAVPCNNIEDMARKASELLADVNKMNEVINFGIEFSKDFGKDYEKNLLSVYNKN